MASLPESHSDFFFCNDSYEFSAPLPAGNFGGGAMRAHEGVGMFPPEPAGITWPFCMATSPELYGVSDMVVPGFSTASYEAGGNLSLEEYYNALVPNLRPDYPPQLYSNNNNWGYKVNKVAAMEEPTMKVGKYSIEERKDRILRYLKKRTQRNFNKTIKYACRKTLADKRVRVRGRFARNNELLCEGDDQAVTLMKKHNDNRNELESEFYNIDDIVKMQHDEEDWLQEAMANLMYFPYVSG